jgi:hypothetical protein
MTLGIMRLSIRTLRITTPSINDIAYMEFCILTLGKMPLSIVTLSIQRQSTLSIITPRMSTFRITTLSIVTLSKTAQYYGTQHIDVWLTIRIVMLSIITFSIMTLERGFSVEPVQILLITLKYYKIL